MDDEELKKLYQEAKLFTYISSSEAMGLPPLEALAAGTTPVVADTPTTREIFGNRAYFVENPDEVENIVIILREALKNDAGRHKIVEGGQEILKKYTWDRHAELMLQLFRRTAQ